MKIENHQETWEKTPGRVLKTKIIKRMTLVLVLVIKTPFLSILVIKFLPCKISMREIFLPIVLLRLVPTTDTCLYQLNITVISSFQSIIIICYVNENNVFIAFVIVCHNDHHYHHCQQGLLL